MVTVVSAPPGSTGHKSLQQPVVSLCDLGEWLRNPCFLLYFSQCSHSWQRMKVGDSVALACPAVYLSGFSHKWFWTVPRPDTTVSLEGRQGPGCPLLRTEGKLGGSLGNWRSMR